uniref:Dirigent protein n=1 Tax=Oryza meridionalis TaxID=40149 RepID=A0A0E0EED6_9ORYZ
MASSSSTSSPLPVLLLLVLLTASSAAGEDVAAAAGRDKLTHIRVYMHERFAGANATALAVVPSPLGASEAFGRVAVLDDELRDGPDPASSALIGRFQGVIAGTSLPGTAAPPAASFHSAISLVFTAGEHAGSTLAMVGPVLGFAGAIERPLVGGTGAFRMARGYCVMTAVAAASTAVSVVFETDLFVLLHKP